MEKIISKLALSHTAIHKTAFFLVIVFAIVIRILAFQGYSDSDPRAYTLLADDLAKGILYTSDYTGAPAFALRIGIYAPPAAFIKAFGLSETSIVAYPFIINITALVLAYIFGRILFGPLAGLIAAAIIAVLPIDVKMASLLYADAIAAFWANTGLLLTWLSLRLTKRNRRSCLLALLAGFTFGISWLCKASIFYSIPFVLILVSFPSQSISKKRKITVLLSIAVGAFAVLSAETFFYYIKTGDMLWRFHATERNYLPTGSPHWPSGLRANVKRLLIQGPIGILFQFHEFLALPAFAIIALAWAAFRRNRAFVIPGLWLGSLMFMFNFMTVSFKAYRPLPPTAHYLYPLFLPASLIVGGFIDAWLKYIQEAWSSSKKRSFLVVAFFCCSIFTFLFVYKVSHIKRREQVERTVAAKLQPIDIIYSDFRTTRSLVFFRTGTLSVSNAVTIPYEGINIQDMKVGEYVLIDQTMTKFLKETYRYQAPMFVEAIPKTWLPVWNGENAVLYRITDQKNNRSL